jgi:hypothetical protein
VSRLLKPMLDIFMPQPIWLRNAWGCAAEGGNGIGAFGRRMADLREAVRRLMSLTKATGGVFCAEIG